MDYDRALQEHYALQSAVKGDERELARALGSLRVKNAPMSQTQMKTVMDDRGGEKVIIKRMEAIAGAERNAEIKHPGNKLAKLEASNKAIRRATVMSKVNSFLAWRSLQLLTGPYTHARNIFGNSMTIMLSPFERELGAISGSARRIAGSSTPRVYHGEGVQLIVGYMQGAGDALRMMARAAWDNDTKFGAVSFADDNHFNSLSVSAINKGENTPMGVMRKMFDYAALVTSWPGRALGGADEFFKVMGFRGQFRSLAFRQAKSAGLSGKKMWERMHELQQPSNIERLIDVATEEGHTGAEAVLVGAAKKEKADEIFADLFQGSDEFAQTQTFTNPLGPVGKDMQSILNKMPPIKFFVPFYKTPSNLLTYAARRSPLHAITPSFWKDLAEGGVKSDLAMSRAVIGWGSFGLIQVYTASGQITGAGPQNYALRRSLEAAGWRPYSIKVNGEWYSYRGLEPITTMMGTYATMAEHVNYADTEKARENIMVIAVASLAQTLKDTPMLKGLDEIFSILESGQRGDTKKLVNRQLTSFMPQSGALRYLVQQQEDGNISRDSLADTNLNSLTMELQKINPFMFKNVPPRFDGLGLPIERDTAAVWDAVNPVRMARHVDAPAADELAFHSVGLPTVPHKIRYDGVTLDLTHPAFHEVKINFHGESFSGPGWVAAEYKRIVGLARSSAILEGIQTDDYQNAPPMPADEDPDTETQGDLLEMYITEGRIDGTDQFIDDVRFEGIIESMMQNHEYEPIVSPLAPQVVIDKLREKKDPRVLPKGKGEPEPYDRTPNF